MSMITLFLILFSSLQAKPFVDCGRLLVDVKDVQAIYWNRPTLDRNNKAYVSILTKDGDVEIYYLKTKKQAKNCVKDFKEKATEKIPIARKLGYLF